MTFDEQIYVTENLKRRIINKQRHQAPLVSTYADCTHSTARTWASATLEVAGLCLACPSRQAALLFKTKQTFLLL